LRVGFYQVEGRIESECSTGPLGFKHAVDAGAELRILGADTLLGKWPASSLMPGISGPLAEMVLGGSEPPTFYFVLERRT
jgi:hypothetical protein